MSVTKVAEKLEVHVLCSVTFFPKIVSFMRHCGSARQAVCFTCDVRLRRVRVTTVAVEKQ